MTCEFRPDYGVILAVFFGLMLFGIGRSPHGERGLKHALQTILRLLEREGAQTRP